MPKFRLSSIGNLRLAFFPARVWGWGMKLLQPAKFFAGAIAHYEPTESEGFGAVRNDSVIQPAVFEVNGVRLLSDAPKSAAEAANINRRLGEACSP